jgi:cell division transport system ATP-binding protein
VIELESVDKVYRTRGRRKTEHPALQGVSVSIESGEFVFLIGSSGSGKSTFIKLLLRETTPTAGSVTVLGRDVGRLSKWKLPVYRRTLGTVFQDFRLLPNKTVYQNVAFALEVTGRPSSEIKERVPEVLALVGLESKAKRLPDQLSGGEQQRVAIARAFVNKPSIILADEPTGNLDPDTSLGILRVLDRINRTGTTVIMATHDHTIVDSVRRRVVELVEGRVVRDEKSGLYGLVR